MDNSDLTNTLAQRKREKPKIYREIADEAKAAAISADVAFKRKNLTMASQQPKVDLNDLDAVKARTDAFLASCEAAAVVPTFLGLAVSFGYTREGLYKYLRNSSLTQTAQYIELVREVLADAMISASLTRATDAATTIFSLKNLHGFSDRIEVAPVVEKDGPLGELQDKKELEARILGTVCLEDEDI